MMRLSTPTPWDCISYGPYCDNAVQTTVPIEPGEQEVPRLMGRDVVLQSGCPAPPRSRKVEPGQTKGA